MSIQMLKSPQKMVGDVKDDTTSNRLVNSSRKCDTGDCGGLYKVIKFIVLVLSLTETIICSKLE